MSPTKDKKRVLGLAVLLLLCAGGGWFLYRSGFFSLRSVEEIQAYIENWTPYSHLIFFLVQFLSVVIAPIPSNISAAAGGLLFGTWQAFLLTFAAVFAGSLLVFWLARVLGRPFADRFVSRRLSEKYQDLLQRKTAVFLTLAFLFPFFPDDVLCILAGLSPVPLPYFVFIVLLARPWGLLFASALGGATLGLSPWVMVPLGLGGAALFLLGMGHAEQLEAAVLHRLRRS